MKIISYIIPLLLIAPLSNANWDNQIINPLTGQTEALTAITRQISPGQIVIVSENHDSAAQHAHQIAFLNALALAQPQLAISVAMEFFEYPHQANVDAFLANKISESTFLSQIHWGQMDFGFYREQVRFPLLHGGSTYAINLPRVIAHRISTTGMGDLTQDERAFLPRDFKMGNKFYRERFEKHIRESHCEMPPEILKNFFEAQSAWDDTMALKTLESLQKNPNQVIVIIVGNFHAEYGGGLPDRLKDRGAGKVSVITQVNASVLTSNTLLEVLRPHPVYGPHGDFVWIDGEPQAKGKM